jgi:CRP/FNR family transcriptional regulator
MLANTEQSGKLVDLFLLKGVRQTFKKGEYVIRPGDTQPGIFYIEAGLVKAYDITRYQEENLLIIKHEAEIFPLIWALTGREHEVIYQTLEPTVTWRISRSKLLKNIEQEPDLMAPILDMTVEMYRVHSQRILNLEYRTVRERIISFLLMMSDRYKTRVTDEGLLIEVPLRHQDIASSINASRETTSREISSLVRKGLLAKDHSFIVIKNPDALRHYIK